MRLHGAALPYYRSHVTRAVLIGTGAWFVWAFLWGPEAWRDTASLHWLYDHGLPRVVIAVLAVSYVALHLAGRPLAAAAGCALGMLLYGWQLVALCFTLDPGRPSNPLALGAVVVAVAMHYASLRLVLIQIENQRNDEVDDGSGR